MTIETERVRIQVAGEAQTMMGYLARPISPGPHPAVIVLQEIFGVNAHIRDVTERVAKEGYVAIAPDYHHRAAPEQELDYTPEGMQKGMKVIPLLTQEGVHADLQATISFLQARKDVRGDRLGCIGFCIGGHVAYLAAEKFPLRATASFYGGGIATFTPGGGRPTVEKTAEIKGKIVCLFGRDDKQISPDQVETIRRALTEHHVRHEVVVYDGADHGFFCDRRASYHPASAADAWQRVKRLFNEELA